ncbi:TATA-box binding [Caloramator fervidus]|uniref:TATA-box binding n=1 Tax=Caloramator fervidus TaxID=29344 RepID=A0A1H5RLZ4_9CLOT|nr:YwmB family TATA-box binding protein [Caloramator fervidus]SEF39124.1 TATA-box binding [Caloramator fervidus]
MKKFFALFLFFISIYFLYFPKNTDAMSNLIRFFNENKIEYIGTNLEYNISLKSKINMEDIKNIIKDKADLKIYYKQDAVVLNIFSQHLKDVNIIDNIKDVLDKTLGNYFAYTLIQGKINRKLSKQEKKELAFKILKVFYGKKINLIEDERYVSLIGYSRYFKDSLTINGRNFNINIAIRDGSDGCTYVLIGNPIITVEY